MNRRDSITALAALTIGSSARRALSQANQARSPARVAILDDAAEPARAVLWATFRKRLDALGYAEGTGILFRQRWANGEPQRLKELADELVASNPDVIVAVTTTAALAAKNATARIPIVAIGPADPVKSGLIASLSHPGGNVTGTSPNQAEIAEKWLEIVREVVPSAKALVYLTDPANPGEMLVFHELQERAASLGLKMRAMGGLTESDVKQAFAVIERGHVDALVVATTAALVPYRRQIVESAARLRLPAVYARREYAEAGGLLSYGTDPAAVFSRAAEYVDRILKGAQPAELPFEMASTFALVVNVGTARALHLKVPRSLLARADRLIE